MNNLFYKKLKELREEKGLSQEKLGELFNMTQAAIGKYEKGTREPSLNLLIKFADFFKVTTDYLLGRED